MQDCHAGLSRMTVTQDCHIGHPMARVARWVPLAMLGMVWRWDEADLGLNKGHMLRSSILLADVSDYIAPGVRCVVREKLPITTKTLTTGGHHPAQKAEGGTVNVSLTLSDCLACSGCVTSAETVLIEQQSHRQLTNHLRDSNTSTTISLATQSLTSLANFYDVPLEVCIGRVTKILHSLGATRVFPVAFTAHPAALLESAKEFIEVYERYQIEKNQSIISIPSDCPRLPLFCSECPGWVSYVAKRTSRDVLARLSSTRSIMGIAGAQLQRKNPIPTRSHHVHAHVAPCNDKKLEACRKGSGTDLVVTTEELKQIIDEYLVEHSLSFDNVTERQVTGDSGDGLAEIAMPPDTGVSGGYAHNVLRIAAEKLFGVRVLENASFTLGEEGFWESSVEVHGRSALRFALCYGQRNLQNLIRRIASGTCPYHYVEVMACPRGCTNGGGQLKRPPTNAKEGVLAWQRSAVRHQRRIYNQQPVRLPEATRVDDKSRRGFRIDYMGEYPESKRDKGEELLDW